MEGHEEACVVSDPPAVGQPLPGLLDPLLLSRIRWVWVISWHIVLPAFTVGLASYIAVLEKLAYFAKWPV